jgi:hypothetical protein
MSRARLPALALALGACGQGSVEVVLTLPEEPAAQPEDVAQVTLVADRVDGDPVTLTAPVRDGRFDLGELPVDDYRRMTVELTGSAGGMVGFGRAEAPLTVSADGAVTYQIPVRRPRTYAAGPTPEATLEAPDTASRPRLLRIDRGGAVIRTDVVTLPAGRSPSLVAAAGVDLFLAAGGMIYRLDSSIDAVLDTPLATLTGTVIDLAGSPDGRFLVAAAGSDLTIIDTASGNTRAITAPGPIGAVTIAREPDGTMSAVALVDAARVASQCGAMSSLFLTELGVAEAGGRGIPLGGGVADIAGTSERPFVAAAELCGNRVTVTELGPDTVTPVTAAAATPCTAAPDVVCAPTAVTATEDRAWAGGTVPAVQSAGFTASGARHQLAALDLRGAPLLDRVITFAELQQPLGPDNGEQFVIDRTMKARQAVVSALSVTPDGAIVTLTSNAMGRAPLVQITVTLPLFGDITVDAVPNTVLHLSQELAVSTRTGAIESTQRTKCAVCESDNTGAGFEMGALCQLDPDEAYLLPQWHCAPANGGEPATDLEGASSSSLFGRP